MYNAFCETLSESASNSQSILRNLVYSLRGNKESVYADSNRGGWEIDERCGSWRGPVG